MNSSFAIGIDLGGTKLRAALVDTSGNVVRHNHVLTDATGGPKAVLDQICSLVDDMRANVAPSAVLGVGMAAAGPIDTVAGLAVGTPTLKGWEHVPLVSVLERELLLPVRVENDGVAAANGEWLFGAGRGVGNLVYVTVSTGIGGGVVLDNRVLHGRRGMAGHIGHMTVMRDGELCPCGNRGCWEAYASGTAFTQRARKLLPDVSRYPDARAVFDAAREGNDIAQRLVDEEADWLGVGIANLLHLYSPELVVLGGGVSNNFDLLHKGIMARINTAAMGAFRDARIVPATLGDNPGLVGAAALLFAPDCATSAIGVESMH